jgi:hypothetical protein
MQFLRRFQMLRLYHPANRYSSTYKSTKMKTAGFCWSMYRVNIYWPMAAAASTIPGPLYAGNIPTTIVNTTPRRKTALTCSSTVTKRCWRIAASALSPGTSGLTKRRQTTPAPPPQPLNGHDVFKAVNSLEFFHVFSRLLRVRLMHRQ